MRTKTLLLKTLVSAVFKALSAFAAFFMTIAIVRLSDSEQAGMFLLAFSILSFAAVFFRLGLDQVLLRKLSSDKNIDSFAFMLTGVFWSFFTAILFSILVAINSEVIATCIFSKPAFSDVISITIWALPFLVVIFLISIGFQAFYKIITSIFLQNLGLTLLFLIGIFLLSIKKISINAVAISTVYLLSAVIVMCYSVFLWYRHTRGYWHLQIRNDELWSNASNLWIATTMSLIVQWSGILIAGALVSSSEIAYLSAAQRTAMLTSFVLMVVNMVVAPRYALLWKENKINEIQRLAKWSTRGMVLLVMPVIAVMLIVPDFIMGLFGDEFVIASNLLAIMAIGQFINVATGSVGYLLNMSGHERDFRKVTMFAGPLTIILSYIFIVQWGVLGAAIATAVGLSLQNIGALFMVRKRLGFWPIG